MQEVIIALILSKASEFLNTPKFDDEGDTQLSEAA